MTNDQPQPPGLHNDIPYVLASSYLKHERENDGDVESALANVNDTAMKYAEKYKTVEGEER